MAEIVDMLAERAQQGAALRKLHKDMESTLQVAPQACSYFLSVAVACRSRSSQFMQPLSAARSGGFLCSQPLVTFRSRLLQEELLHTQRALSEARQELSR
jgi:hypothetical protein